MDSGSCDKLQFAKNTVHESEEIIVLDGKISATGINSADALHLAAAIISDCDYFITTDRRILIIQNRQDKRFFTKLV